MGYFSVLLLLPRYCYFFLVVPYSPEGVYLWLYYFFSFSLQISLFLFCSLSLYFFSFRWFFSATASKTSKGVLQSFYYQK